MITVMPESHENILVVQATQKLTSQDYETVFIPRMGELIEKFGKIRTVVYLDEQFEGWELGAMWDDAKFGMKHKSDFEKVAVVGGPKWIEWGTKLGSYFMEGEVKTFDEGQLSQALDWIKS